LEIGNPYRRVEIARIAGWLSEEIMANIQKDLARCKNPETAIL
jgi:hypothetical protein